MSDPALDIGEHGPTFSISPSSILPWYHSHGLVHKVLQQILQSGEPMILSLDYLPWFAGGTVNVVDCALCSGAYLKILQDKAETCSDRFEWTKGIRGVSCPTEE